MVVNKQSIKIAVQDEEEIKNIPLEPKKTIKRLSKKLKVVTKKPAKKAAKKLVIDHHTPDKTIEPLDIKTQIEVEEMNVAIKNKIGDTQEKKSEIKKINVIDGDIGDTPLRKEITELAPEKKKINIDELLNEKTSAVKDLIKSEESIRKNQEEGKVIENFVLKDGKRSLKLYRRIAYFFVSLTIVLLLLVLYFTFAKVTITLIPNQERISSNMIFDVFDKDNNINSGASSIKGIVKKVEISKNKEYKSSGEEIIGKEAAGKVVITNNYVKNQPLVASTRFLTLDGKLFRLRNTVNVPAGGSVEAELYADEPNPDMAVNPTKFTIPGLWAGLQDKIYAESKETISYSKKAKKYVTADDIENSVRDLKQQMLTEAKIIVNEEYKEYEQILYKIDESSISSEVFAETGEEKDIFNATMKANVVVVAFNDEQATNLAKQKFISSLPEGREMLSFDEGNIVYVLNNYDSEKGSAAISATFEGRVSLSDDYDVVNKDMVIGLNEGQLNAYLEGLTEIAGFEVDYKPSFIKRVPRLKEKIDIKVKR